ncbi:antimicrobial peptide NK-lysin isoform X1 [Hemibagrus wyckioides]|uniref:antimicrobial peptide NK-lysin-like n=1 Tax=Hemibagrus wyckioides TaxID=337641 RepID=UPI00266BAD25|nr:antimicrobial peptide NK-lysin-like [Hemibagrus wyckioides]XP_058254581.1 antimicrobial peptide NK-lysin isoform X1 [Hemibagrus wyckioides]
MQALFQLGVLLLILGAAQCKDQLLSDKDLEVYTYERDLQEEDGVPGLCHVCTKLVGQVLKMIGNEVSKNSIDQALNKVCEKLKVIQSPCKKLINKYRGKLVNIIMSTRQPKRVCKLLKLCIFHENKM